MAGYLYDKAEQNPGSNATQNQHPQRQRDTKKTLVSGDIVVGVTHRVPPVFLLDTN